MGRYLNKNDRKEIEYKEQLNQLINNRTNLTDNIVGRLAFLSIQLDLLQEDIRQKGNTVEYVNGRNQHGYQQNPSSKTYVSFHKAYISTVKQLLEVLSTDSNVQTDELAEFLKRE